MKFLVFILSLVMMTSAHARTVCGVEMGDKAISIMARVCKPLTAAEFRSEFNNNPNFVRECVHEGKSTVVLYMARSNQAVAFDLTTKSDWKECKGQKVPVSLKDIELQQFEFNTIEL